MGLPMAFWDNWFRGITDWITKHGWNQRPTSAWFIAIVSVFISLLSVIVTRLLVDVEALNEDMKKVNEWNQRRKRAMETADKKLWLKVKRDEEQIRQLQSRMMMKRMKPTLVTFIPFLLIFSIIRSAFSGHYYAWLPFNMGGFPWIGGAHWFGQPTGDEPLGYSKVPFSLWYFITAFAFGSLLSRLFGANPSGAATLQQKTKQTEKSQQKKALSAKQKLATQKIKLQKEIKSK